MSRLFCFPVRSFPFHFLLLTALLAALLTAGCGGSSASRTVPPAPKAAPVVQSDPSGPDSGPAASAPDESGSAPSGTAGQQTEASGSPSSAASPAAPASADGTPAQAPKAVPVPSGQATAADRVNSALSSGYKGAGTDVVAECWAPLVQRLQNDPKASPELIRYFCALPEYSPAPMGAKVKELFTSAFIRKPKVDDGKPKPPPSRIYRNVVTAATLQKCTDFLETHKATFDAVEAKYPVPREVLVALLFVETRLGTYVGKENAFWSLACMAAADSPERVRDGIGDLPLTEKHDAWLQSKLTDKSNWAYNELRSFLAFCSTQGLDPHVMPGSVYGAIGICQFMPSNLLPYGDDGDGDGVVNLFSVPDAIFSAARYLTKHGWQAGMTVASQRSTLKRYNNLNIYANTILALAETVRTGALQSAPPDAPITIAAMAGTTRPAKKKS